MKNSPKTLEERGFALVVTLSLMILLTILAVGLLSLATVSLRSTGNDGTMSVARSNARLALMLAIGELQKSAGPDQRITAPANLVDKENPMGITGVWKSWKPGPSDTGSVYNERKLGDNFLGYLMSGTDYSQAADPSSLPQGEELVTLLGKGSLGSEVKGRQIDVPLISTPAKAKVGKGGACGWVTLDEGVKGRLDLEPANEETGMGHQISRMGAPARNRFEDVKGLDFLEVTSKEEIERLRETLPKLASLKQVSLAAEGSANSPELDYFHDFTVSSSTVQANVADGGLKTDLSVLFEGTYGQNLSSSYANRFLYSDTTTPYSSSNSDVQWSLYANYARLYRLAGGADGSALTGLVAKRPSGYQIKTISDNSSLPAIPRYEPQMSTVKRPMLLPTVVRVDMVFSVVVRKEHAGRGSATYPNQLHMMYLPVVTLHNPYNTPLRCTNFQISFDQIPIGFQFLVNGQLASPNNPQNGGFIPLEQLYHHNLNSNSGSKSFTITLSNSLTSATELVMEPGEALIFGKPFPDGGNWANNKDSMFDYKNDLTKTMKLMPGMMTGPADGIGFDIDWLVPESAGTRAPWVVTRLGGKNDGVILVNSADTVQLKYRPLANASNRMTLVTSIGGQEIGRSVLAYKNLDTLTKVVSEGVSQRFPENRNFPATYPPAGSPPKSANALLEGDSTPFKEYVNAKPFAIFSVGAKTSVEAFTPGRTVADTGIAFQMAFCDFRSTPSQGACPLEFALVPVSNGGSAIEADGRNGFFFGGHGTINGATSATVYEIPLAPLQSIAQLRHANAASIGTWPLVTYSVGESRAHPAIPSSEVKFQQSSSIIRLDHSWLANSALWDRYWFSSVSSLAGPAYQGSSAVTQSELFKRFFKNEGVLPNERNKPYAPGGMPSSDNDIAGTALGNEGKNSAAYIMTDGGFNVNSTSIPAWECVLSAMAGSEIPLAKGSGNVDNVADPVFPRFRRPTAGSGEDSRKKLWNACRHLEKKDVRKLAETIVEEVRARGPFLSMAEFINRRLDVPGELSNSGALQAAIDKAGLNAVMLDNSRGIDPSQVSAYGWNNPDAVEGSTGAGAPGEISQGDVLSVIGSFATVRSDTFRIRTYGDARDSTGKIVARAWCEAVVQRVPDFVDPADAAESAATADPNVRFGRQLRVVAFRWLSPEEV